MSMQLDVLTVAVAAACQLHPYTEPCEDLDVAWRAEPWYAIGLPPSTRWRITSIEPSKRRT